MKFEEANKILLKAIQEIKKVEGIDLGEGKKYTTVDQRLDIFRKHFGMYAKVKVNIKETDLTVCKAECIISFYIETEEGKNEWIGIANANAIEYKNKSHLNSVSYVENCETSAIGRALRFLGLFGGDSGASVEEVKKVKDSAKEKGKAKEYEPKVSDKTLKKLKELINDSDSEKDILKTRNIKKLEDLTEKEANNLLIILDGEEDHASI